MTISANVWHFKIRSRGYDGAGDVTQDTQNQYLYDADGRICAVYNGTTHSMTEYLYDADGTRVGKGAITSFSCDTTANGFTATESYVLSPGGQQLTELTSSNGGATWTWAYTNVWAGGKLIAAYSLNGSQAVLNFQFRDWLGTLRAVTDYAGNVQQTCQSAPYGNGGLGCSATPYFFTQHERDSESGNDYFGARYYASSMGRWGSPDPSGLFLADPGNPQSFNLYAYVDNMPLRFADPDGLQAQPDASQGWLRAFLKEFGHAFSSDDSDCNGNCLHDFPPGFHSDTPHWMLRPPATGHYFTVGLYPSGAGWFSHMGDAVDSQNTSGWATAINFSPLDRMEVILGIPFAGLERADHNTYPQYADKTSGIGHPLYLYYPIDEETFQSVNDRIQMRFSPKYGEQHQYWLYLNSCGQNVGDDMRAAHIPDAPPRWLFAPWLDYLWIRVHAH